MRGMDTAASWLILTLTLVLILFRPRGIPAALSAMTGAFAVLALRLVSLRQAWDTFRVAQDALLFLIGMMTIGNVVERAGFFEWCANLAARAGGGSVRRLYFYIFLTGTLITAFLSLDATAIMLTPIVHATTERLRLRPLPFLFACAFVANTASLFMPISNLTNLLIYRSLDMSFFRFSAVMFLPALLAVGSNVLVFGYIFRSDVRGRYARDVQLFQPEDQTFFTVAVAGLILTLVAVFIASIFRVPIGLVTLVGATLLLAVCWRRGWGTPRAALSAVPWNLVLLVVGLFIVIGAVGNAGLTHRLDSVVSTGISNFSLMQISAVAAITAIGSNLINNIPTTIITSTVLHQSTAMGPFQSTLGYAALVGTNVGPNLSITGSLATLIWLNIVRRRGMSVTTGQYLRLGIVSTPIIFASAVVGLWLSLHLFV